MTAHRILLVSSSSGSLGGGELYLDGLAEGLVGLGHEVLSLVAAHPRMNDLARSLARWGAVRRTELIVNTYDRKLRSFAAMIPSRASGHLVAVLRSLRPDVVHLNKQNVEDGLDLLRACHRSRLPLACTVHVTRSVMGLGGVFGRGRDWVARAALGRARRCEFVAVAGTCREQLMAYTAGMVSGDRVHAVPNGVGTTRPGDRTVVRADWGVGPADVVLGCVARIEAQKDPLFALDVLAGLPPHVHLVWVGDGRLRAAFEEQAVRLGLANRVHLDGWRPDARERMAGFDVFVLPSAYEGFPFAVLEAMAAGLPVVASDVDGIREAVADGETGWLCPSGDRNAWVARLIAVAADPDARGLVGRAAEARHRERFSLEAMARGTAAVYEAAIRRAVGAL